MNLKSFSLISRNQKAELDPAYDFLTKPRLGPKRPLTQCPALPGATNQIAKLSRIPG
jgi:hypothetical protein